MSNCFEVDLSSLTIAELLPPKQGGQVGANISPVTILGKPVKVVLGEINHPVRVPFPVGTFDRNPAATRVNICFEVTDLKH